MIHLGGGGTVFCLEGNGSRPSHQGNGYSDSNAMYTLNTIEHHAVAYRQNVLCLNDQGGDIMSVGDKAATLRAQMKHHEPIVCMMKTEERNG